MDGKGAQRKGSDGEREFAKLLQAHGFECKRTPRSGGMDFKGDLWGMRDHHWEVKRVKRLDLPAAWRQAIHDSSVTQTTVVAHRKNQGEWMCTLRAEDYVGMLAELRDARVALDDGGKVEA